MLMNKIYGVIPAKVLSLISTIVFKIIPIAFLMTFVVSRLRGEKNIKKSMIFTPLITLMAVVPLIVFLKEVPINADSLSFKAWPCGAPDSNNIVRNIDFFSYYKSWWIIICSVIAWFIFLWKHELKSGKYNMFHIPILTYLLFVILSTFFSPFGEVARKGVADRYENIWVIIGYLIIVTVIMNVVKSEKDVKTLIYALFASSIIAGTIGIFQYFGLDFFQSTPGQTLMLPAERADLIGRLAFRFGVCNIYSTMYNTNYVGSYMIMILMITFAFYVNTDEKNYIGKVSYGALSLLMFANLIGSRSRAGMIGGVAALIVMMLIMRKNIIKNIYNVLILIILAILVFQLMNNFGNGVLFRKVSTITKDAKDISGIKKPNVNIFDIYADKNSIIIDKKTKEDSIKIEYNLKKGEIKLYDLNGKEISVEEKPNGYAIKKAGYEKYRIVLEEQNIYTLVTERGSLRFIATDEGMKYVTKRGEIEPVLSIKDIKRVEMFDGKEKVGTGRVFIWSRTIPLLKDRMLLGSGPDTFSLAFPQNDHIGKYKTFGNSEIVVDKPHNMYLQIGVNTGVMSLVAFLVLLGAYFITGIKAYFNSDYENYMEIIGGGIFLAIIGYCVAGIFNDSLVSVAPVFWGLLGIGIAVNMINLKYDGNNKVSIEKI